MVKICFAASSGGHFEQLMMLKPLMNNYDSFIITEKTHYQPTASNNIYFVQQINRKEPLFIVKISAIFLKSLKIFLKEKPDIIISTGALSTVPICIIGKMFNKKIIFIESFAKVTSQTLTGKLIYKFADLFLVQWEELKKLYPKAVYRGGIY